MKRRVLAALVTGLALAVPQFGAGGGHGVTMIRTALAANPNCPLVASPPDVTPSKPFDNDTDIEANYNQARTAEGCNVTFTLPNGYDSETPQQQTLTLMNLEREARGFGDLNLDTKLMSRVAYNHSLELAKYNYFDHFSPINQPAATNSTPNYNGFPFDLVYQRQRANPIISASANEFTCQGEDLTAGNANSAEAVFGLMYQDAGQNWGHRKTILGYLCNAAGGDYDWTGIGYASVAGSNYGKYWTLDFLQDSQAPYNPAGLTMDTIAPTMGTLTYVGNTATITLVNDNPPSANQAGVTSVVFYTPPIQETASPNLNTSPPTFNTYYAAQVGNPNVHSGNGTYTATVPGASIATLHVVAVDGSGNFTDCTALTCTGGVTAALLAAVSLQRHGNAVTFHWVTVHTAHLLGFKLFAGRHALNAGIIPAHRSSSYTFTARNAGRGPFALHILSTTGRVTTVAIR